MLAPAQAGSGDHPPRLDQVALRVTNLGSAPAVPRAYQPLAPVPGLAPVAPPFGRLPGSNSPAVPSG